MKILTIIPARCGSKGVKDKNVINICNKPLIAYSIESANLLKENNLVDEVIVSTDCNKIADVAKKYGANVPFLRPKEIAKDNSKSIEFMLHAIEFFERQNRFFDAILLLQPTSPIRSFEVLKKAILLFEKENEPSLISVYKEEYINELVMYNINNNRLIPLNKNHNKGIRRQEHKEIYIRNGAIYLTKVSYLKKEKLIISDNPLFVEMKKSDSINIDTIEDVELLRTKLCR